MKRATESGDIDTIRRLAEEASPNLHTRTMTSETRMMLWEPETVHVIRTVQKIRHEGIPVWYSINTGPSDFAGTYTDKVKRVADRLLELGVSQVITRGVGGRTFLNNKHLF